MHIRCVAGEIGKPLRSVKPVNGKGCSKIEQQRESLRV
jgi:hypothetical protein